jgi:ADP-heptose:LPS heptosyltransferase
VSARRILIVNLTRFGDLLQTSPAITDLKSLYPEARLTLVAERNFADVCEGIPGIDEVYRLDFDRLGRLLLEGGERILEAHGIVRETALDLRERRFDLALNFSSSRMSAVLLGLLQVPDVRGWCMTDDGFRAIRHPWARLFATSCLNRRFAPFNLVDSYRSMAGGRRGARRLLYDVPETARCSAREVLASAGIGAGERVVALQLGASRDVRRWPVASFAELARRLSSDGMRVVLVGGPGERAIAAEVAGRLERPVLDLCGRTSIAELGALLERADLVVSGDTGPMHMAAAVGTPVVALFFGPALPFDTGPYGEDHVMLHAAVACAPCEHSVTCLNPFCRERIGPELVARVVRARLTGDWEAVAAAANGAREVRIYRGCFDRAGYVDCRDLGSAPPQADDVVRWAYRAVWLWRLAGVPLPEPFRADLDLAPFARLAELAARGAATADAMAAAIARDDLDGLERLGAEIEGLDGQIARVGVVHPEVRPVAQMFQFGKENLEEQEVGALVARTRELYGDLAAAADAMSALLGDGGERKANRDAALR